MGNFFKDIISGGKDIIKTTTHIGKDSLSNLKDNPTRAFVGAIDPYNTAAWNKVLGKDWDPLVSTTGGMTQDQFASADNAGINTGYARGLGGVADTVSMYYGGNALGGLMGGAGGATGATTGSAGGAAGAGGMSNMWGNIIGSGIGALGSIAAGNEMADASEAGNAELARQYNISRADMMPFLQRGNQAGSRLWELLQDPDYIENIAQPGIDALDSSAAARGLYGSTAHLSDIANHVSNNARGEYMNRLASLAGSGQTASNNMASLGQNNASNIANGLNNIGNARASSYLGIANAGMNGLNQYNMQRGMGYGAPTSLSRSGRYIPGGGWQAGVSGNYYPDGVGG